MQLLVFLLQAGQLFFELSLDGDVLSFELRLRAHSFDLLVRTQDLHLVVKSLQLLFFLRQHLLLLVNPGLLFPLFLLSGFSLLLLTKGFLLQQLGKLSLFSLDFSFLVPLDAQLVLFLLSSLFSELLLFALCLFVQHLLPFRLALLSLQLFQLN